MQQHPIPQNVTSYQFRLVGEMTLGQFGRLMGGFLAGLLFYALPLPGFIKWLFIAICVTMGALFAFFPIEGRPLEVWIISFFRSIYSPTQYVFQKESVSFSFLTASYKTKNVSVSPSQPNKSLSAKEIALLRMLSGQGDFYSPQEKEKAQKLLSLFETSSPQPAVQTKIEKPTPPPQATKEAVTSQELPIPAPPEEPNVLVGMVIDREGKIVEGAIIEIEDEEGNTVRAIRTNKLGQFRTVSPLDNGTYRLIIEKEGHHFDIIKIELKGEIIPPLKITEKSHG